MGNTSPTFHNVDPFASNLVNIFSVVNGGFGISYAGGTHVSPKQAGRAVKSLFTRDTTNSFGDDYINSLPDEFRQLVSTSELLGRNNLSVGDGNFLEMLSDSLFDRIQDADGSKTSSNFARLLGAAPGLHLLAGLTGADTYNFAGLWGSAVVLEPPDIAVGGQGANAFPHSLDTLNFGNVESDLHVTLLQADSLDNQSGGAFGGLDVPVAIVTSFDISDLDFSQFKGLDYLSLVAAIPGAVVDNVVDTVTDIVADGKRGNIVKALFGGESSLALDGGIVVATGIESIIGGGGTTTVRFLDDWGAVPVLGGRIVGNDVVLDYSDLAPQELPGSEAGITVANTWDYTFDPLAFLEGRDPFSADASNEVRANDPEVSPSSLPSFRQHSAAPTSLQAIATTASLRHLKRWASRQLISSAKSWGVEAKHLA